MAAVLALFALIGIVAYLASLYNSLVSLRRQTANAFSQIEIQLRRRYDLIPNLVSTVKAYMTHERQIFQEITEARDRALKARTVSERASAERQVKEALIEVYAIVEGYPDLKSDGSLLSLQADLRNTEDKIAFARQYYNDVVTTYNTTLETFPTSLFATIGHFAPKELFVVEHAAERENVRIAF